MRILHVGNIANNGYNNAKFLRRKGIEADIVSNDCAHIMAQPEWEDAEFDEQPNEFHPQWHELDLGGFRRPAWFLQDERTKNAPRRKRWFKGQFHLESLLRDPSGLRWILQTYSRGQGTMRLVDILKAHPHRRQFEAWFEGYDLIQAYALEPINAFLYAGRRPYVAFEHGTMRDIPFEDSSRGRLLTLAYQKAGKVIITNPDVIIAARRLGLTNYLFIPHPVDETKYVPRPTPLRARLMNRYQTEMILFAPSRHDWDVKRSDLLLKAFARFRKATRLAPVLVLCTWGQEVERSKRLIADLSLDASVVWMPPLNKTKLIDFYNASDVVLDQFAIGTFGTVTPEAMACGKPVMLHFDRAVHEWCYTEMPPVVTARTETEIYERLVELSGDPGYRNALGQASREWIVKHHGWELVADRQIAVYRELLSTKDTPRAIRSRVTPGPMH
jgi:glycosyltransferase involved in cell wall biosynthesis